MGQEKEKDLEISLDGAGIVPGGLTADDFQALADLFRGLKAYDPSLKNIHAYEIRGGSATILAAAPTEMGLMDVRPPRSALRSFFEEVFDPWLGWLWNAPSRASLGKITKRDQAMRIEVSPAIKGDAPFRRAFTRDDYRLYSQRVAEEPRWRSVTGEMLEIDIKDRTFEIHTGLGVIVCGFPEGSADDGLLPLVGRAVTAEVLSRGKPGRGRWTADRCRSAVLAPEPVPLPGAPPPDEMDRKLAEMLKPDDGFDADYAEWVKERRSL